MANILDDLKTSIEGYFNEMTLENGYNYSYTPKTDGIVRDISYYTNDTFPIIELIPSPEINRPDNGLDFGEGNGGSVNYETNWEICVYPLNSDDNSETGWFSVYSKCVSDVFKIVNDYCSISGNAYEWQVESIESKSNDQESIYKIYIFTVRISFEMRY